MHLLRKDCVLDRNASENKHKVLSISLKEMAKRGGRIPIAYELEGYSTARNMELKERVRSSTDEKPT